MGPREKKRIKTKTVDTTSQGLSQSRTITEGQNDETRAELNQSIEKASHQNETTATDTKSYVDYAIQAKGKYSTPVLSAEAGFDMKSGTTQQVQTAIEKGSEVLEQGAENHVTSKSSNRQAVVAETSTTNSEHTEETVGDSETENYNLASPLDQEFYTEYQELHNFSVVSDAELWFINGKKCDVIKLADIQANLNKNLKVNSEYGASITKTIKDNTHIHDYLGRELPLYALIDKTWRVSKKNYLSRLKEKTNDLEPEDLLFQSYYEDIHGIIVKHSLSKEKVVGLDTEFKIKPMQMDDVTLRNLNAEIGKKEAEADEIRQRNKQMALLNGLLKRLVTDKNMSDITEMKDFLFKMKPSDLGILNRVFLMKNLDGKNFKQFFE